MRRALVPLIALVPLAAIISCSDMPTAPRATVTIEGSVRDRDGAPMRSAGVFFSTYGGDEYPYTYAFTDPSGSFQVALVEGDYQVRIQPDYVSGYAVGLVPKFTVNRTKPRLDYKFTGTKISGDVTGPSGALLSGVNVGCYTQYYFVSGATVTTTNGHYALIVPPGAYSFFVQPGYSSGIISAQSQIQVSSADTTVDFDLSGFAVTATVTLGGAPLMGATIGVSNTTSPVSAGNRTGLDGTAIVYLPAGDYYYFVAPPAANIAGPVPGTLSISGDTSFPVAFPATRWNVTLRRASDNTPISPAYIRASEIGSNQQAFAPTDAVGRVQLVVKTGVGYGLEVDLPQGGPYLIPYVSSAADSTFDVVIPAP